MRGTRRQLRYGDLVSVDARFELMPIPLAVEAPLAHAECIRIARRLRTPGLSPTGFVPVDDHVSVAPVAIQLAAALVELTGEAAAYIDGMARISSRPWAASGVSHEDRSSVRWLRESLALVTPGPAHGVSRQAMSAQRAIAGAARDFRHVLVDLTGFVAAGESARIMTSLQRVVAVATAGTTQESTLLAAVSEIPAPKRLGVLLVG